MPEILGHPIFAALYDLLQRRAEEKFFGSHRAYLAGGATGRVLDVGSGTGINFGYYRPDAEVVGVEPDRYMLRRAKARADRLGRRVRLLEESAEQLPFPDASFDVAVATLVFCTVASPDRALAELRRVLRAGGQLRFLEHGRAETAGWSRFQDFVTRCGSGSGPAVTPIATQWERSSALASGLRNWDATRSGRTLCARSCAGLRRAPDRSGAASIPAAREGC